MASADAFEDPFGGELRNKSGSSWFSFGRSKAPAPSLADAHRVAAQAEVKERQAAQARRDADKAEERRRKDVQIELDKMREAREKEEERALLAAEAAKKAKQVAFYEAKSKEEAQAAARAAQELDRKADQAATAALATAAAAAALAAGSSSPLASTAPLPSAAQMAYVPNTAPSTPLLTTSPGAAAQLAAGNAQAVRIVQAPHAGYTAPSQVPPSQYAAPLAGKSGPKRGFTAGEIYSTKAVAGATISAANMAIWAVIGGTLGGVLFYVLSDDIKEFLQKHTASVTIVGILAGVGTGVLISTRFSLIPRGFEELGGMLPLFIA